MAFAWKHGLRALAGVARKYPVDFAGRPDPEPLGDRIRPLTSCESSSDRRREILFVERQAPDAVPRFVVPIEDVVVEAIDGDAAVGIEQRGQDLREGHAGVHDGPAEAAGMQITGWAVHVDLTVGEAP